MEISVTLGVGELNQKGRASQNFILSLGLDIAHQFMKFFSERDCIKKRKAEKACDAAAKRRRGEKNDSDWGRGEAAASRRW